MQLVNQEKAIYEKKIAQVIDAKRSAQKIIRFFPQTDMRNGHDGLAKIAKDNKINVSDLNVGEYVIFTNKKKNAIKMYAPNHIIVHQRLPSGAKLDMRVISLIPKYFNGSKINLDAALKEAITRALK
jgi:hypothetical protein